MRDLLPVLSALPERVLIFGPLVFLLFIAICYLVFRRSKKQCYQQIANFPLED